MKGISTILAMILIVIIVVALIGLTYTFAIGLFTTTSGTVGGQVSETTKRLDRQVSFIAANCKNISATWNITFTLRHNGATYNIESGDLAAYWKEAEVTTTPAITSQVMLPGKTYTFSFENTSEVDWHGVQTLTISAPASPISQTITCPTL
jgi:FlaG/FlaF family flagellin (archaellin)